MDGWMDGWMDGAGERELEGGRGRVIGGCYSITACMIDTYGGEIMLWRYCGNETRIRCLRRHDCD